MYWIIDGLCFASGITQTIYSAINHKWYYSLIGLGWVALYPFILQTIYNILAKIFGGRVVYDVEPKSRFVYSNDYNISFCGLEKLHPFDSQKYGNIVEELKEKGIVREQDFVKPGKLPRSLFLEKMSKMYLIRLCYSLGVCAVIQMPLCFLPGFLLRWRVLNPMLYATEGTILAACIAKKLKWAVNLSGGFHHASFENGGGFCVYPDITLAIHYLQSRLNVKKVMVIDLDAHQGNGHEMDNLKNKDVYTVDFYNHHIYPNDTKAKQAIHKDKELYDLDDARFLNKVDEIEEDIDNFLPEFVIYNAGTDILENDPLGNLNITAKGVIQRDEKVMRMCIKRNIPVIMVLSGGYQKVNAHVISESIENLMNKFN